jgi:tRNA-(ms[2]io[6]A)-hydroxylase
VLRLRAPTTPAWLEVVTADLDRFLQDHAANERKVCGSALKLAVHYPERQPLVDAMVALAREELDHFTRVYRVLVARGRTLAQDAPDPYMGALQGAMRKRDVEEYLVDRLVVFAIVEARACERFSMLADALPDQDLRAFYAELARAEARHHGVFLRLAALYAPADDVAARLDAVLAAEAEVVRRLPVRPALH